MKTTDLFLLSQNELKTYIDNLNCVNVLELKENYPTLGIKQTKKIPDVISNVVNQTKSKGHINYMLFVRFDCVQLDYIIAIKNTKNGVEISQVGYIFPRVYICRRNFFDIHCELSLDVYIKPTDKYNGARYVLERDSSELYNDMLKQHAKTKTYYENVIVKSFDDNTFIQTYNKYDIFEKSGALHTAVNTLIYYAIEKNLDVESFIILLILSHNGDMKSKMIDAGVINDDSTLDDILFNIESLKNEMLKLK